MRVQRPCYHQRHRVDHLAVSSYRPELQPPGRRGYRRAGPPLEAKPLHHEPGTGLARDPHPFLDRRARTGILVPVRRDEADVLRRPGSGRDDLAQRGSQQPDPGAGAAGLAADVKHVKQGRARVVG
jgi:hypothetical protein